MANVQLEEFHTIHTDLSSSSEVCYTGLSTCRAEDAIGELLKEVQQHSATTRFDAMANIIAVHSQSDGRQGYSLFLLS